MDKTAIFMLVIKSWYICGTGGWRTSHQQRRQHCLLGLAVLLQGSLGWDAANLPSPITNQCFCFHAHRIPGTATTDYCLGCSEYGPVAQSVSLAS